jgi:16S rRNA (uracil1498-N3)-methyltransferase
MRMHRFYISDIEELSPDDIYITHETNFIHQLKNVFRFKVGQKILIFNEKIGEIEVELIKVSKIDMSFKFVQYIKESDINKTLKRQVSLYMSIIKNNNFDLVVEKAVELGVNKIVPVISERTIKNDLNIHRLNRIIKEATEQSGRMSLMVIDDSLYLDTAINKSKDENNIVYFGSIDSNNHTFNRDTNLKKIAIFIGPEGGFSDDEINIFLNKDIKPIGLGDYVLRAETAAIVGCGLISL